MKRIASYCLSASCLFGAALAACTTVSAQQSKTGTTAADPGANLAIMAQVGVPGGRGGNNDNASPINNGIDPKSSGDLAHGSFSAGRRGGRGNRGAAEPTGTQTNSVQYSWTQPISTKSIAVYWQVGGGRRGLAGDFAVEGLRLGCHAEFRAGGSGRD